MPSKEELKAQVCREIDKRSEEIIGLAKEILENPETGFREFKTSRIVTRKFGELGLKYLVRIDLHLARHKFLQLPPHCYTVFGIKRPGIYQHEHFPDFKGFSFLLHGF